MAKQAKQSKAQKETVERVMHEFKVGKLRIRGTGSKVKNPKQAIAIALHEAGASNQESPGENRRNLQRTKAKERQGKGAANAGASRPVSPRERLGRKVSKAGRAQTRAELYAEAKRRNLPGRSTMSKDQLEHALKR
jgi:hypothetical protein